MKTSMNFKEQSLGQLVTERPGRAGIFESFRLDYCCGGRRRLDEACAQQGIDVDAVARMLEAESLGGPDAETDLATMPLAALCDHNVRTHHDWLRRELPNLAMRAAKVAEKHGPRDPRLVALRQELEAFTTELDHHMWKEEQILFPAIRAIEQGEAAAGCGHGVDGPIRVMMAEHDNAGESLGRMRALTENFEPPASACLTHRALLDGLAALERDMHRHVHAENNVLFPRAQAAAPGEPGIA